MAVGCVADVSGEYVTLMFRVYVAGVVMFRCTMWPRSQSMYTEITVQDSVCRVRCAEACTHRSA